MENVSPPLSPLRQALKGCVLSSTDSPKLGPVWIKRAEEELNETPERYQQELNTLKNLVLSK